MTQGAVNQVHPFITEYSNKYYVLIRTMYNSQTDFT